MTTPYNDSLTGGVYDDYLYGGAGNDILNGYLGNDGLVGGTGNDVLLGYGGGLNEFDGLHGGFGADLFQLGDSAYGGYYLGSGFAVVADFFASEGDKFVVAGNLSDYTLVNNINFVGTALADTAIYKGQDLIGIVQDNPYIIATQDFVTV